MRPNWRLTTSNQYPKVVQMRCQTSRPSVSTVTEVKVISNIIILMPLLYFRSMDMPLRTEYDPTARVMAIILAFSGFGIVLYGSYMSGLTGYFNPMFFIFGMILCGIGGIIMMLGKRKIYETPKPRRTKKIKPKKNVIKIPSNVEIISEKDVEDRSNKCKYVIICPYCYGELYYQYKKESIQCLNCWKTLKIEKNYRNPNYIGLGATLHTLITKDDKSVDVIELDE